MSEKAVTELRSRGDQLFKKGDRAGAARAYFEVVKALPDSVEDRQKLRKIVRKARFEGEKPGIKDKAKAKAMQVKLLALDKGGKSQECMETAEEYLLIDPSNSPQVVFILGKALEKEGHLATALWCYEDCASLDRNYKEAWRAIGNLYFSEHRDFEKARSAFATLLNVDSTDHDAHKMIKRIDTEETLSGGVAEAVETGDHTKALRNQDLTKKLEQSQKIARTQSDHDEKIAAIEADIIEEPDNVKLYEKLGDAQRKARYFKKAEASYLKLLEKDSSNFSIKAKIGDMKLEQFDLKIKKLEEAGQGAEAKKYEVARDKVHMQEFAWRVKSFPSDLKVRYEYGNALYKQEKFREALAEYQQAQKDSSITAQVSLKMADCFEKDGKPALAVKALERALEGKGAGSEIWKELTYRMAHLIAEENSDEAKAKAKSLYEKIYEHDVTYKDVADQV